MCIQLHTFHQQLFQCALTMYTEAKNIASVPWCSEVGAGGRYQQTKAVTTVVRDQQYTLVDYKYMLL